jgi:transcriptional regulator with PAS, ATPase and Fis domain
MTKPLLDEVLKNGWLIKQAQSSQDSISSIIETLIALFDDALALVDANGFVYFINDRGRQLFDSTAVNAQLHLKAVLNSTPKLYDHIMSGNFIKNYATVISIGGKLRGCLVSSLPLRNKTPDKYISSILTFKLYTDEYVTTYPKIGDSIEAGMGGFLELLGNSPAFIECKQKAIYLAPRTAPILLTGEVYTGKRSFARAIRHAFGNTKPFVSINCAQLNDAYGSKTLFGFESMSKRTSRGLLEQANGGVLLLDYIENLPLDLQLSFIRNYDERQITRIGGAERVAASYKILATSRLTHDELKNSDAICPEMYFRLSSFIIDIPPLRERKTDIPILVDSFIENYYQLHEAPFRIKYSDDVISALMAYSWPGNVMQLRAIIHYVCDICKNRYIRVEDLPADVLQADDSGTQRTRKRASSMQDAKKQAIINALGITNFNITKTAQSLGISRTTLYKQIKKHDIQLPVLKFHQ